MEADPAPPPGRAAGGGNRGAARPGRQESGQDSGAAATGRLRRPEPFAPGPCNGPQGQRDAEHPPVAGPVHGSPAVRLSRRPPSHGSTGVAPADGGPASAGGPAAASREDRPSTPHRRSSSNAIRQGRVARVRPGCGPGTPLDSIPITERPRKQGRPGLVRQFRGPGSLVRRRGLGRGHLSVSGQGIAWRRVRLPKVGFLCRIAGFDRRIGGFDRPISGFDRRQVVHRAQQPGGIVAADATTRERLVQPMQHWS